MSRRLREEGKKEKMFNSFHLKLDEEEKKQISEIWDTASEATNEAKLLKHEVRQLQSQLQGAYSRIKTLREENDMLRTKIANAAGVPSEQLEFNFWKQENYYGYG